jgi:hypothetical protein
VKSIALGGSTAVKVAAVIAAGSAVIAAGSDRPAHKPAPPAKRAPHAVVPALAAAHLRPPMIRMHAALHRAAAPVRHAKARSVQHAAAPERRTWAQHIPSEPAESTAPAAPAKPAQAPASAPPVTTPSHEKPEPAEANDPPAAKEPKEPEAKPETQPERPSLPPTANENAADNPSSNAPGQAKDRPKKD